MQRKKQKGGGGGEWGIDRERVRKRKKRSIDERKR